MKRTLMSYGDTDLRFAKFLFKFVNDEVYLVRPVIRSEDDVKEVIKAVLRSRGIKFQEEVPIGGGKADVVAEIAGTRIIFEAKAFGTRDTGRNIANALWQTLRYLNSINDVRTQAFMVSDAVPNGWVLKMLPVISGDMEYEQQYQVKDNPIFKSRPIDGYRLGIAFIDAVNGLSIVVCNRRSYRHCKVLFNVRLHALNRKINIMEKKLTIGQLFDAVYWKLYLHYPFEWKTVGIPEDFVHRMIDYAIDVRGCTIEGGKKGSLIGKLVCIDLQPSSV